MSTADSRRHITRRHFLKVAGASTASLALLPGSLWPAEKEAIFRVVPSTKTTLPVIGMGSWLTFDVHMRSPMVGKRVEVLRTFFNRGGALIDSSPMYGLSEEVIGYGLKQLPGDGALFSATKVWSRGQQRGIRQMGKSLELWGVEKFDLMQIHNMVDWEDHLETLRAWKANNRLGHIGITTSHGRRHDKLERALKSEPFDFVQFTYNLVDRQVEKRLLPLAADLGLGVIINRPFRGGRLFSHVRGQPLPDWAAEFDCRNWAQFFLKFIASHPAVTCAIPATRQVPHMMENMAAGYGLLPDEKMRQRMIHYFDNI